MEPHVVPCVYQSQQTIKKKSLAIVLSWISDGLWYHGIDTGNPRDTTFVYKTIFALIVPFYLIYISGLGAGVAHLQHVLEKLVRIWMCTIWLNEYCNMTMARWKGQTSFHHNYISLLWHQVWEQHSNNTSDESLRWTGRLRSGNWMPFIISIHRQVNR
jgi:hypothetical protein